MEARNHSYNLRYVLAYTLENLFLPHISVFQGKPVINPIKEQSEPIKEAILGQNESKSPKTVFCYDNINEFEF